MVDNEYSRGKVDNEYDFCAVTDQDVKRSLEKLFMKSRVSFFLRWDKPGILARIFAGAKEKIVFCINVADLERAENAVKLMNFSDSEVEIIKTKSNNKHGY